MMCQAATMTGGPRQAMMKTIRALPAAAGHHLLLFLWPRALSLPSLSLPTLRLLVLLLLVLFPTALGTAERREGAGGYEPLTVIDDLGRPDPDVPIMVASRMTDRPKRILVVLQNVRSKIDASMPFDGAVLRDPEARLGLAGSGSSMLYFGEGLAAMGHEVVVVGYCKPGRVYGVEYRDFDQAVRESDHKTATHLKKGEVERERFDAILVFVDFSVGVLPTLAWATTDHLILHASMQSVNEESQLRLLLEDHPTMKLSFHSISEWGANCIATQHPNFTNHPQFNAMVTVPSALDPSGIFDGREWARRGAVTRVPRRFLYHAVWERGAVLALWVVEELRKEYPDAEIHFAMYAEPPFNLCDQVKDPASSSSSWCHYHGALSKAGLASLMASCDYFVYPLVNVQNKVVHKDTYASVMLEAMAMGLIAITASVAALAEHYKGHALLLDVSSQASPALFGECMPTVEEYFGSDEYRGRYVQAVRELEQGSGSSSKEEVRARGQEWALQQTYVDRAERFDRAFLSSPTIMVGTTTTQQS